MSKPREYKVILDEDGLCLPCGNTPHSHLVIDKSYYDALKAENALLSKYVLRSRMSEEDREKLNVIKK